MNMNLSRDCSGYFSSENMSPKSKDNPRNRKKVSASEDDDDEDYRKRRDRNNQAVKKSRVKSKQKTLQTLERVNELRTENELLEEKINMLQKELGFLKDLFLAQAGSTNALKHFETVNLQELLGDGEDDSSKS